MSAITTAIEKAIYDWVVAGSGLSGTQVIWAQERGPQPSGCYVSLRITDEREYGDDWTVTDRDINQSDEDGSTITLSSIGPRVATLQLECFAAGDTWATAKPDRRLASVLAARRLPSIELALRAAGIGIGPVQPVESIELERAKLFEPRARCEVTLHLVSTVSETAVPIEHVEITPFIDVGETDLGLPELDVDLPPLE